MTKPRQLPLARVQVALLACVALTGACAVWPGVHVERQPPLPESVEEEGVAPEAPLVRRLGEFFVVQCDGPFVLYERSLSDPPTERSFPCAAHCEFTRPTTPGAYAYSVVTRSGGDGVERVSPRSAERYVTVE